MLRPVSIPGLFVTGTDTGVGKTIIAAAIADSLRRRGARVGVCKPVATGCEHRREGWVSEDAELLAHCADSPFPLDVICPQRYAEPLAPAVAAQRSGVPMDWAAIERSLRAIAQQSDIFIVEGVGGIMVPLDEQHTVLDLADWLKLPAVVVAHPGLGTINHTLLTVQALRSRGVPIAGVVINRYPAESASIAEETSPRVIEQRGRVPILCIAPDEPFRLPQLPPGVTAAIDAVDWATVAGKNAASSKR